MPLDECCWNGKADQLQKAFEVMFITSQRKDAAILEWHDEKFETNSFYFSPGGRGDSTRLTEAHIRLLRAAQSVSSQFGRQIEIGHPAFYEVLRNEEKIREV
jgi:hypothetical protein